VFVGAIINRPPIRLACASYELRSYSLHVSIGIARTTEGGRPYISAPDDYVNYLKNFDPRICENFSPHSVIISAPCRALQLFGYFCAEAAGRIAGETKRHLKTINQAAKVRWGGHFGFFWDVASAAAQVNLYALALVAAQNMRQVVLYLALIGAHDDFFDALILQKGG